MAKFDFWSDLHIDSVGQPNINFKPENDLIVIAGDVSDRFLMTNDFIDALAERYKKVIYVDGNHEHWGRCGEIQQVEWFEARADNAQKLTYSRPYYFHDNGDGTRTMFVGMNGWYDFNYPGLGLDFETQKQIWYQMMANSDEVNFSYNGKITHPEELADNHASQVAGQVFAANFSEDMQHENRADDIVIVTHTVPHVRGVVPPSHPWANGNGSFYNSLMLPRVLKEDKNKLVSVWCYGHTHYPNDFQDGHIRFVCNARGRFGEQAQRGKLSQPISIDSKDRREYK